jgi:cellobiose transport system permease protein
MSASTYNRAATAPPIGRPAPLRPRGRRRNRKRGVQLSAGPGTYVLLGAVILISLFPIYWSLVGAGGTNASIAHVPPKFYPGANLFHNIARAFTLIDLRLALINSLIVSTTITLSVLLTSTLAGFAFAKLRFRGRNILLGAVVATMMVPPQLGIIPLYIMMANWLHWSNTIAALIVPAAAQAFGVFFMRQYLITALPVELIEAARVDGATTLRVYWNVVLPVARPAMAVLGMLTFMAAWNDFYWPLVVMTPQNPTMQVALSALDSGYIQDYSLVLTGALISMVPILVVFALMGRQILDGIMQGAIKA